MTFKLSKKESDAMDKIKAKLDAEAKPKPRVVEKDGEKIEIPAGLAKDIPEGYGLEEHMYDVPELMQSDMGREAISDVADFFFDRVSAKTEEAAKKMGFSTMSKDALDKATVDQLDNLVKIKHDLQLTTLLAVAFVFSGERMSDQDGDLLDFNIKQFLNAVGLTMKVGACSLDGLDDLHKLARAAGVDLNGIIQKLKDKHGDPRDMTDDEREAVLVDLKAMLAEATK